VIEAGYINCPEGQIHFRQWLPEEETRPPLLCLHPAPFSGLFFTTAMAALGAGRRVIAPDYPGYGASSVQAEQPTIEDYAVAMLKFVQAVSPEGPVDVLGFHTGCLVGAEMQLQSADSIGALVLVDVPYFVGAVQESMLEKAASPLALDTEPESIAPLWKSGVGVKAPLMGMARSVELLSEQLRVYPRAHLAFHAAFTYPCQQRFERLPGPVAIIGTQSGLLDATRESAAAARESALFIEATEITRGVFEEGAPAIAARIDQALRQLQGDSSD
jgi:pimeloyl-ACP methyl ester carboxylesterase